MCTIQGQHILQLQVFLNYSLQLGLATFLLNDMVVKWGGYHVTIKGSTQVVRVWC